MPCFHVNVVHRTGVFSKEDLVCWTGEHGNERELIELEPVTTFLSLGFIAASKHMQNR